MPDAHDGSEVEETLVGPSPSRRCSAFVLDFVEGPSKGTRITIDSTKAVMLGKGAHCHVRLDDPAVSRQHASLALDPEQGVLHLRDLGSTNGTRVNGVRVQDALLKPGALVRIGLSMFRVDAQSAEDETPITRCSFGRYLGRSRAMQRLYPLLDRLAASDVPVVIEGETGTGKELLAEAIHESGPRASGPYVVLDCTIVPPNLMEAELFGNERGAFTGASGVLHGLLEQADGGTLFIDEIGDLDPNLQPKLLRAIERSEFRRIGGDRWQRVDLRVIAATRRQLEREVRAERFRDDLYHRLAVGRIQLPPLRKRRDDIELLARKFWTDFGGAGDDFPVDVLERWQAAEWRGNVRELRNAVARMVALGQSHDFDSMPPPSTLEKPAPRLGLAERLLESDLPLPAARMKLVAAFEKKYIARMLAKHAGNVKAAAAEAGIGQRYFNMLRSGSRRPGGDDTSGD